MFSRLPISAGFFALAFLCLSLALAGDQRDKNALLKQLDGEWTLEAIETKGEKRQGDALPIRFRGMKQTFKGDQMTITRADGVQFEFRIVVRGDAEPFELDIMQTERDGKQRTLKCIFKFVDQKLILAEGQDERPKSFETNRDVTTKVSSFTRKR